VNEHSLTRTLGLTVVLCAGYARYWALEPARPPPEPDGTEAALRTPDEVREKAIRDAAEGLTVTRTVVLPLDGSGAIETTPGRCAVVAARLRPDAQRAPEAERLGLGFRASVPFRTVTRKTLYSQETAIVGGGGYVAGDVVGRGGIVHLGCSAGGGTWNLSFSVHKLSVAAGKGTYDAVLFERPMTATEVSREGSASAERRARGAEEDAAQCHPCQVKFEMCVAGRGESARYDCTESFHSCRFPLGDSRCPVPRW
jgi:hypothetical protein